MQKELKTIVKEKYAEIARSQSSCCSPSCCEPSAETAFSESYEKLEGYVPDADLALGCGIPTEFAQIKKGDTVLDLGSGAGNDVFVARSLTGETGRVIGVDMTEEMIAKAEANRRKLGYENVEFRLGDIEDMPLEDNTVDVAISNCVMNLVPDKERAYAEVYRVLKPGGHFSISDIVTVGELTPAVRDAAALYAGCVSGALQKEDYLAAIERAGFKNIQVQKERLIELPDELLLQYLPAKELSAFRTSGSSIYSVNVYAEKG
jgi:SAM-dependent methyltransferase